MSSERLRFSFLGIVEAFEIAPRPRGCKNVHVFPTREHLITPINWVIDQPIFCSCRVSTSRTVDTLRVVRLRRSDTCGSDKSRKLRCFWASYPCLLLAKTPFLPQKTNEILLNSNTNRYGNAVPPRVVVCCQSSKCCDRATFGSRFAIEHPTSDLTLGFAD